MAPLRLAASLKPQASPACGRCHLAQWSPRHLFNRFFISLVIRPIINLSASVGSLLSCSQTKTCCQIVCHSRLSNYVVFTASLLSNADAGWWQSALTSSHAVRYPHKESRTSELVGGAPCFGTLGPSGRHESKHSDL